MSALGHAGVLAIGLIFVWASPQEAVPPDAMLVEIVTPQEMPRLSGTPSDVRTSGSATAAKQQTITPKTMTTMSEPPQPKTVPPPQPKEQRKAEGKEPQRPQEPQTAPPQTQNLQLTQAEVAEVAMSKPTSDPPAPSAEEAPDAADTAATLAQLALLGGRFGGGFAAPPIDSPLRGYDYTVPFRERVSSCAALPPGVDSTEKISIRLRVFLNRDGTLAAAPQLREPNPSAKQQALMQNFVSGLQKCQPYTMLPQDKYKQWKMLDLVVYPLNSFGG